MQISKDFSYNFAPIFGIIYAETSGVMLPMLPMLRKLRKLRKLRFCKNVGIDECFLCAMPSFCENVGIDECFLCAMPSFCQNVGIE